MAYRAERAWIHIAMRSPPVVVLLAIAALLSACKMEPPDISEEEARGIAQREFQAACDGEGLKCSDFKELGKTPPGEPDFEFAWQWLAPNPNRPVLLKLLVSKKGVPALRMGNPTPEALAAASAKPAAAASAPPAVSTTTAKGAPPAVSTATAKGAPVSPVTVAKADPKAPSGEKTPPPLPSEKTPPPPPPSGSNEGPKLIEPTFKEVVQACETEIGILCLSSPDTVAQARRCLKPHRAALRTSCGKVVGLKRSEL